MSDTLRVVAIVADKNKVIFYKEDGETFTLQQGDPRLARLLEDALPIVTAHKVAVISLDDYSVYSEFEKKSGGFMKMFKVAKDKVASIFKSQEERERERAKEEKLIQDLSPKPIANTEDPYAKQIIENAEKQTIAPEVVAGPDPVVPPVKVERVIKTPREKLEKDLVPVGLNEPFDNETIVAVIGDVVIPNMEKLKPYLQHALNNSSFDGVRNFLTRISKVIDKRGHSIEDLLRFMEKADLPIADDGSIVAYKLLKTSGKEFVDCHTGLVRQNVGSYVHVDISLVDQDRRHECSNGLHIARRAYLGNFGGDTCFIIKMNPEDVVTVPHNDPNKVRVMGYHLLGIISPEGYTKVKQNRPMTDGSKDAILLHNVLTGNHIGITQDVHIKGQKGSNVEYSKVINGKIQKPTDVKELTPDQAKKASAFADPEKGQSAAPINPRDLNKKINKQIEQTKAVEKMSNKERAHHFNSVMIDETGTSGSDRKYAAKQLLEIKKSMKVSWTKLGLPEITGDLINKNIDTPDILVTGTKINGTKKITEAPKAPRFKAPAPVKPEPKAKAPTKKPVQKKEAVKPTPKTELVKPKKDASKKEWARYWFNTTQWPTLHDLKKKAKVNWERLGFTEAEIKEIESHLPKK